MLDSFIFHDLHPVWKLLLMRVVCIFDWQDNCSLKTKHQISGKLFIQKGLPMFSLNIFHDIRS